MVVPTTSELVIFFLVTTIIVFTVLYLSYALILYPLFSFVWYSFKPKVRVYGFKKVDGDELREFEKRYFLNSRRQRIDISDGEIVEIHGERVSSLRGLKKLDFSNNLLPTFNLGEFHNKTVQEVNISQNKLRDIEFGSKAFCSLRELNLADNQLSEFNIADLLVFTALEELDLARNKIRDVDLGALISCLSELKSISFAGNKLESIKVGELQTEVPLENLDLSDNILTKLDLDDILGLTSLKSLNISSCNIVDLVAQKDVEHNLEKLDLSGTVLQQDDIAFLKRLTSLQWLTISLSDLIIDKLEPISNCKDLQYLKLELDPTRVVSVDLTPLWGLKNLRRIEITGFGQNIKVTPSKDSPPRAIRNIINEGGVQVTGREPPISPPKIYSELPYIPVHLPRIKEMKMKKGSNLLDDRNCEKCEKGGIDSPTYVPESWFYTKRVSYWMLVPIIFILSAGMTFILPHEVLLFVQLFTFFIIYSILVVVIFKWLHKLWWPLRYTFLIVGFALEFWAYLTFLVEGGVYYDIGSFATYLVDSLIVAMGLTVPYFLSRTVEWLIWLTVAGSPLASFSILSIFLYIILHPRIKVATHHFIFRCSWCSNVKVTVLRGKKIIPLEYEVQS